MCGRRDKARAAGLSRNAHLRVDSILEPACVAWKKRSIVSMGGELNRTKQPDEEEMMKIFLAIAAVLAWLFGAMLLFAPTSFYAPTGIAMTPMIATIAQAHGATLIGLGVVDWMAREAEPRGARAVLAGNLVVQVLSLGVVIRTMMLGAGASVAPGVVIHLVLGALFATFLVRLRRASAAGVGSAPAP